MKSPDIVLFDLGNVLVSIHPAAFTRHLGIDATTAYRNYQQPIMKIVRRYEGGQSTTEEYLDAMSKLFEGKYERDVLREAMLRVIGSPVAGMEEVVRSVGAKRATGLVSNTNELHFEYCRGFLPALRHLKRHYLSYVIGSLKPSEEYYRHVLSDLASPPDSVLFIDDLLENVEGARKAGMNAILFSTSERLRAELQALRIL